MAFNRALGPGFVAGGTIPPFRIVKLSTTAEHTVLACTGTATDIPFAISQQWQKRAPGLPGSDVLIAAESGDPVDTYGLGDTALVMSGGTVALGDFLTCGGTAGNPGLAITASASGTYCIGQALRAATATGQLIEVLVDPKKN